MRIGVLCRYFSLILVTAGAEPAWADIDVSILRSPGNTAPTAAPATKSAAPAVATEKQPAQTNADAANEWYLEASRLEQPGASREDLIRAASLYRMAAEQGHTDAQTNLANMYAQGLGVAPDGIEALRWYRKAAEGGNVRAQYSLALMYHLGEGVNRDFANAIRWYESAARQGDANAMNNMAFMYGMGEGVVQSNVEAYAWFAMAASRGNADAAENRDLALQEMTPEERREARARYERLEEQYGL